MRKFCGKSCLENISSVYRGRGKNDFLLLFRSTTTTEYQNDASQIAHNPGPFNFFAIFCPSQARGAVLSRGRNHETIYSCMIWPSGKSGREPCPSNRPMLAEAYTARPQGQGRHDTYLKFMRRPTYYLVWYVLRRRMGSKHLGGGQIGGHLHRRAGPIARFYYRHI